MTLTIRLGMANGTIPAHPVDITDELIASWQEQQISVLATSFGVRALELTSRERTTLRDRLAAAGVAIVQFAGVNANLAHPDAEVRREALRRAREFAPVAAELGAERIISGCGTVSPDWQTHFYAPHPENHTPATEAWLADGLAQVGEIVAREGIGWSVECHQLTTMRSPEAIRRVLDIVDSPAVLANFDPVNLLDSAHAVYRNAELTPAMLDTMGPRLADTIHVKDVVLGTPLVCHIDEAVPGEGQLDFGALFDAIHERGGPTRLIIEHLPPEQTRTAIAWVRQKIAQHGLVVAEP